MPAFDVLCTVWFLTHIPITLFVDAQMVLPLRLFPRAAVELADWYVEQTGDPLVRAAPPWLRGMVWCELLLQLPYFFVAAWAYGKGTNCSDMRLPSVAYGAHTCTTLVPILTEIWHAPAVPTDMQRLILTGIYAPYFLIPLLIGAVEYARLAKATKLKAN